jgi:hypothetical protein
MSTPEGQIKVLAQLLDLGPETIDIRSVRRRMLATSRFGEAITSRVTAFVSSKEWDLRTSGWKGFGGTSESASPSNCLGAVI